MVIMKFLVVVLALPAISICSSELRQSYGWKINSTSFWTDLQSRVARNIEESPGFGIDTVGFSLDIKEKGLTLTMEQGEVKQISGITYTPPVDFTYVVVPATSTIYTIQKSVTEYRFVISTNDTSYVPTGYATFEFTGVSSGIAIILYNKTEEQFAAEVIRDKVSSFGNLESIKLSDNPIDDLESYMQEIFQEYILDFSSEVSESVDSYIEYNLKHMEISKYIIFN